MGKIFINAFKKIQVTPQIYQIVHAHSTDFSSLLDPFDSTCKRLIVIHSIEQAIVEIKLLLNSFTFNSNLIYKQFGTNLLGSMLREVCDLLSCVAFAFNAFRVSSGVGESQNFWALVFWLWSAGVVVMCMSFLRGYCFREVLFSSS